MISRLFVQMGKTIILYHLPALIFLEQKGGGGLLALRSSDVCGMLTVLI